MVFELIAQMIAERNDCDASEITMDSKFADLAIDSMDTMEMIVQLEEKLGHEIDLDEAVETVGDLVRFIEKKIGAQA
ncbi:MAG: acyl carrier protein [Oscillospiraceae bacterium]|nr:acyl carrier protein [Oscillospiraceae bacterium]